MNAKALLVLFSMAALSVEAADPILPNPALTPGAVFTNVTVEQITQKGYANRLNGGVRKVPESEKKQIFNEYFGLVPTKPGLHYEVDHLISLELGGSNDPKNLWPETYSGKWGAKTKDKLENRMAKLVRNELKNHGHDAATALLKQFQNEISTNWIVVYPKYISPTP